MSFKKHIPKITVGRYAGTPIDQLPINYLRWMMTQDFPKDWLDIADRKIKASRETQGGYLELSRHAIDNFSIRFLEKWYEANNGRQTDKTIGLASMMAIMAQEAWDKGRDTSKHRHQHDGIVKEFEGIQWVFGINPNYPDYKDVITVMSIDP